MNRREFSQALLTAGAAASAIKEGFSGRSPSAPEQSAPGSLPLQDEGFPAGSYTPFGYLDNPHHCWVLHPSGVLRSVPPLGLGLYFPAGPGGYFDFRKNSVYRSIIRIGLRRDAQVYYDENDFRDLGVRLTASYHSKNILTLEVEALPLTVSVAFLQLDEHTLACLLSLRNGSSLEVEAEAFAVQRLELGASEWWGRDGVAGSYEAERDCVLLRSFAAGPAFALSADVPSVKQIVTAEEASLRSWMTGSTTGREARVTYYPDPLHAGLGWAFRVPAKQTVTCNIFLSRDVNQASAVRQAHSAKSRVTSIYLEKRSEDDRFWSRAPQLEGDFPQHWKNSWVYDFETLRMMVRQPVGVYKHPWDAMQIQAPRNVLAETSIDMWTLSYADEETAKLVLLGQFQDALEPNVPCMREDGTMNMVAADGSECGTSLQWCYPFYCLESVLLRTVDLAWLAGLYPFLGAHLDWTLKNRTDREGWMVPKCSWESGMDASERFLIKQPTGGELIDFVRVAELQAAMSHAARVMKEFAKLLEKSAEMERWDKVAATYAEKARQLWYEGWFYDQDARTGRPIVIAGHREVTQVGPVMCDVATSDQVRAMVPKMREYESNQQFWLEWPSHMLPYLESVWKAGDRSFLSHVLFEVIDRVYQSMDRRDLRPEKKLGWPGVSCEVWGKDGAYGGEGYGWGATLPAHIIRSIVGFREGSEPQALWFWLGPNLPDALFGDGKSFGLLNLHYRGVILGIRYECGAAARVGVRIHLAAGHWSAQARVVEESGTVVSSKAIDQELSFAGLNHGLYRVEMG
jgi:hypothetical protein